jgi:hypothetical protein
MRVSVLAAAFLIGASSFALAQDQEVIPPRTVYWMDMSTQSGMTGGMAAVRAMMGGGGSSSTMLTLEIGSQDAPTRGAVSATHTVPRGARVGPELRLTANREERGQQGSTQHGPQQPRGRLFLFFGCGERAPRGQPVIIDFARVAAGEMPQGLESRVRAARTPNSPGERGWPSVAHGPRNRTGAPEVIPAGGSVVGDHLVRSPMASDIRFSLTADHDVMAPVSFTTNAPNPSGSVNLVWNSVPRTTGYALAAMGQGETEGDMVYWTASGVRTWDANIFEFLPPSEAARLVRERVLLAPNTTTCTVPQEVASMLGVGGGGGQQRMGMVFLTAFGPEANFVDPPRPSDPQTPWRQISAVKVRMNSTAIDMLGQSMAAMARGVEPGARDPLAETAPPAGMSQEDWCRERAEARRQRAQQSAGSAVGGAVGSMTGIPGGGMVGSAVGGLFGRRNQPEDPHCPAG